MTSSRSTSGSKKKGLKEEFDARKLKSMSLGDIMLTYEKAKNFVKLCEEVFGTVFGVSTQRAVPTPPVSSKGVTQRESTYDMPSFLGNSLSGDGEYLPVSITGVDPTSTTVDYGIQDAKIGSVYRDGIEPRDMSVSAPPEVDTDMELENLERKVAEELSQLVIDYKGDN